MGKRFIVVVVRRELDVEITKSAAVVAAAFFLRPLTVDGVASFVRTPKTAE